MQLLRSKMAAVGGARQDGGVVERKLDIHTKRDFFTADSTQQRKLGRHFRNLHRDDNDFNKLSKNNYLGLIS
jgi:hypothetical protein